MCGAEPGCNIDCELCTLYSDLTDVAVDELWQPTSRPVSADAVGQPPEIPI
jgi:hypothetical protein